MSARGEARILRSGGGLEPVMASAGARAYIVVWGGAPVGIREQSSPEAESSVAFEAPAEEPNLTLVSDIFAIFRLFRPVLQNGARYRQSKN